VRLAPKTQTIFPASPQVDDVPSRRDLTISYLPPDSTATSARNRRIFCHATSACTSTTLQRSTVALERAHHRSHCRSFTARHHFLSIINRRHTNSQRRFYCFALTTGLPQLGVLASSGFAGLAALHATPYITDDS